MANILMTLTSKVLLLETETLVPQKSVPATRSSRFQCQSQGLHIVIFFSLLNFQQLFISWAFFLSFFLPLFLSVLWSWTQSFFVFLSFSYFLSNFLFDFFISLSFSFIVMFFLLFLPFMFSYCETFLCLTLLLFPKCTGATNSSIPPWLPPNVCWW